MKKPLHIIHEKIAGIQLALLRYNHKDHKVTLHGSIQIADDQCLNFILADAAPMENLLHREITLVQKDRDNYIYVDGEITKVSKRKNIIVSVKVNKACWFIRKRKGSVSSLQEKCIYENVLKVAS